MITTIVDDSTIEAYFEIPERDVIAYLRGREDGKVSEYITSLQLGLQLADHSEYALPGTIDFMDNRVDPLTRTIRLRAVYPNPDAQLASGLFAYVRIPVAPNPAKLDSKEAVLVPAEVVLLDIAGSYVWVVDAEHRRAPHGPHRRHRVKEGADRTPPVRRRSSWKVWMVRNPSLSPACNGPATVRRLRRLLNTP